LKAGRVVIQGIAGQEGAIPLRGDRRKKKKKDKGKACSDAVNERRVNCEGKTGRISVRENH